MPSKPHCVVVGAAIACLAGCVEDPPAPDISNLSVTMRWNSDDTRNVVISIAHADIPCTEVEDGLLGESAVECTSAPWTLHVDGVEAITDPVTCWSAHRGLFGHVPKRCEGGKASLRLPEHASEDVEIVAATDSDENRIVLRGIRRTYAFVQETSFQSGQPGVVRVDALELEQDLFSALFSQSGAVVKRDGAHVSDPNRMSLSPFDLADGSYAVRVLALASQGSATIAVPIEGTFAIGP